MVQAYRCSLSLRLCASRPRVHTRATNVHTHHPLSQNHSRNTEGVVAACGAICQWEKEKGEEEGQKKGQEREKERGEEESEKERGGERREEREREGKRARMSGDLPSCLLQLFVEKSLLVCCSLAGPDVMCNMSEKENRVIVGYVFSFFPLKFILSKNV